MHHIRTQFSQRAAMASLCPQALQPLPMKPLWGSLRSFSTQQSAFPLLSFSSLSVKSHQSSIRPFQHQSTAFSASANRLMRFGGGSNRESPIEPVYSPQTYSGGSNGGGDLPEHVRDHLTRTYMLLASGVGAAAVGSCLMMFTPLCKVIPFWFPMVGAFVPLLWLNFAPPANPNLKLGLFFTFCFLEGMAIAPIVWMSKASGVLFSALFLTFAVFAGFTAAAFLAPQGRLLAFQGPLFAILIGFVGISFLNMFFPSKFAHSILLYGGLALFSALVAVDTQSMIERARCGVGDHVQDAMGLFINMINIFVRIAQILRGDN